MNSSQTSKFSYPSQTTQLSHPFKYNLPRDRVRVGVRGSQAQIITSNTAPNFLSDLSTGFVLSA